MWKLTLGFGTLDSSSSSNQQLGSFSCQFSLNNPADAHSFIPASLLQLFTFFRLNNLSDNFIHHFCILHL
jgi:hypothetical protein